jgi:arylsulfatase A-like enzyme
LVPAKSLRRSAKAEWEESFGARDKKRPRDVDVSLMNRAISCLIVSVLSLSSSACGPSSPETSRAARPNIVYIMADDLGYGDLSGYGRKDYSTPALDKLASEGTRFTHAYAIAPVCTPTRVGLMTGQYPARHRAGLWEPLRTQYLEEGLDPARSALARRLRDAGYHTGLVGKWHLGWNPGLRPSDHGFHQWFSILSGGADYVLHRSSEPGNPAGSHDLYQDGKEVRTEGYLTDIFTDQAEAFLRSAPQPFFLNLEYSAPHWPWQQRGDAGYPDDKDPSTHGGSPQIYAGMMKALDEGVARVLEVLAEKGYADNTIVIFTSDNGGEVFSNMAGLEGMKLQLWEGGIRVPAFVRWPGVVPAGRTTEQVATTLDWTATMLAAAGATPGPELDGVSLLPHLRGDAGPAERTVFWRSTRWGLQHAVRQGNWKYLRMDRKSPRSSRPETGELLFDLSRDPQEKENLAGSQPEVLDRLRRLYAEWESGVLPPIEPVAAPARASTR